MAEFRTYAQIVADEERAKRQPAAPPDAGRVPATDGNVMDTLTRSIGNFGPSLPSAPVASGGNVMEVLDRSIGNFGPLPENSPVRQAIPETAPSAPRTYAQIMAGDADKRLGQSAALAADINPAVAARILDAEKKSGLPRGYVEQNLDEVERMVALKSFDPMHFRAKSPKFAAYLGGDAHALAVAKKDLSQMGAIETAVALMEAGSENANPRLLKLWEKELDGQRLTAQETVDLAVLKRRQQAAGQAIDRAGPIPWALAQGAYAWRQAAETVPGQVGGALGGMGVALMATGGVVAAPVLAAGALVGGLAVGAVQAFNMERASAWGEFSEATDVNGKPIEDKALVRTAANVYGALSSVIETGSDAVMGGIAVKLTPGLNALKQKLGVGAAKVALKQATLEMLKHPTKRAVFAKMATGVAGVMGTEWVEEASQTLLQTAIGEQMEGRSGQTFAPTDWAKAREEAVKAGNAAAVGTAFIAGPAGAIGMRAGLRKVERTQQEQVFFKTLSDTMSQSDMVKNAPDVAESAVAAMTADTGVKNVYVPVAAWDAMFQADARGAAQEILGDTTQYDEAKGLTGADLVIPIEKYAAKVAGTPLHAKLTPDLRLEQGGLSAKEAANVEANYAELMKFHAEAAQMAAEANAPLEQIRKAEYDMVRPFMGEREATRHAELVALKYGTRANRMAGEVDVFELWKAESANIKRDFGGTLGPDAIASQSNFAEMMRDSRLTTTGQVWAQPGDEMAFYTGSGADITAFRPRQAGAVFLSPSPSTASEYAYRGAKEGGAVYKVFASARKPFDYDNAAHVDDIAQALEGVSDRDIEAASASRALSRFYKSKEQLIEGIRNGAWGAIEHPAVQRVIKSKRYDAFWVMEEGVKNIGIYDPKMIKSAVGNRGTYDTTKDNILYQSASIRRGTETLRKYGLKPGQSYKTREVAAALETRQREKYGSIAKDDRSPETLAKIAKWMAEEVAFEMQHPEKSGVGWYSAKFQNALTNMAEAFPELSTDKVARNVMTMLIAITSDGQKVVPNFAQAMDIYGRFRPGGATEGKFTTSIGHIRQASINNNMKTLQGLYDKYGPEKMHDYLMQEMTLGELKKVAAEHGTTLKSDYQVHIKLPMAALELGPKLGAFYANLMGSHGYLTMDRWWSRTFNRYRGTLLPVVTDSSLIEFQRLIAGEGMSPDQLLSATVPYQAALEARGFKTRLAQLVGRSEPSKKNEKYQWEQEARAAAEAAGERFELLLSEHQIERAANTIHKTAFTTIEDAPFNATDRTFMLDATAKAQANLAKLGHNLSIADIQAILWYYEKRLYGELGARQSADISYEEAARRVVAEYTSGDATGSGIRSLLGAEESQTEDDAGAEGGVRPGDSEYQAEGLNDDGALFQLDPHSEPGPKPGKWYFSQLERAVEDSGTRAAPATQWLNTLRKTPGVKPAEIEATGLAEWLALQEGNVPREAISDYLKQNGVQVSETMLGSPVESMMSPDMRAEMLARDTLPQTTSEWLDVQRGYERMAQREAGRNSALEQHFWSVAEEAGRLAEGLDETGSTGGSTKFSQWQLPGGEGYKELLLTLPEVREINGQLSFNPDKQFRSSHFDQPNILAHVRFNERVDADGKKVLFLEEVQSDWAQMGRKEGFKVDEPFAEPKPETLSTLPQEYEVVPSRKSETKSLKSVATNREYDRVVKEFPGDEDAILAMPDGARLIELDEKVSAAIMSHGLPDKAVFDEWLSIVRRSVPDAFEGASNPFEGTNAKQGFAVKKVGSGRARLTWSETQEIAVKQALDILNGEALSDWTRRKSEHESRGIPLAPFVAKTEAWVGLALKRMIRYAVENGFDRVAWTTGEQQAARYDLSKQVESLEVRYDTSTQQYSVYAKPISGGPAIQKYDLTESALSDVIGKELAAKFVESKQVQEAKTVPGIASAHETYSGIDLKVGGEGMKSFYDKIVPGVARDILKKLGGGPLGEVSLPLTGDARQGVRREGDQWVAFDRSADNEVVGRFATRAEAEAFMDVKPQPQPGFDITPKMEDAVMGGQSLFQNKGTIRGQFERARAAGQRPLITLFRSANPSTILHELGHSWLEELRRDAEGQYSTLQLKADWEFIKSWSGMANLPADAQIPRASHELFARNVEAYFRTGQAPSIELRGVFSQFAAWLVKIYRSVRDLIGEDEIHPEFRKVMDRLLATDEQIAAAQADAGYETTALPTDELTAAEATEYQKKVTEVRLEAEERVRTEAMNEVVRERTDWWRAEKALVTREVEAEVNARPEYQARSWLRTGRLLDGSEVEGLQHARLDRAAIAYQYGEAMLPKLAFMLQAQGGHHPDVVAQAFGYDTGDAMLRAITEAQPRRQVIAAEVDRRMMETHGDMLNDGGLAEKAIEAVHSDKQADVLLTELRILKRMGAKGDLTTLKAVQALAAQVVSRKMVGDLKPGRYISTGAKAGYEAEKAMIGKDYTHAFDSKLQQLMNLAMTQEIMKRKAEVDKAMRTFKLLDRSDERLAKSRDMNLVNTARAILGNYGLGKKTEKADAYFELVEEYDPATYADMVEMVRLAAAEEKPYTILTVDEFAQVKEVVDGLWTLSRTSKTVMIDDQWISRDAIKAQLAATVAALGNAPNQRGVKQSLTKMEEYTVTLLDWRAALSRVEHWVDLMDGGKPGAFRKYIWQPVSEAADRYRDARKGVMERYLALTEQYLSSPANPITSDPIDANLPGEIDYVFRNGKAELLGALLHIGNLSNLAKLLIGGRGENQAWGEFNADGTLNTEKWDKFIKRMQDTGTLTKADYDFIQSVWDLMESLKPAAQAAHREMYGHYFDEVTANAFATPWGQYKGGYAPAVTDPNLVTAAAERADEAALRPQMTFMFPTTGRGFTKSRIENYRKPLQLNLGLVPQHIDKVLRFTHIEPRVREVSRIAMDKEFRANVASFVDTEVVTEMLVPWLERAAQQQVETPAVSRGMRRLDNVFRELRTRTGMQIMVGNVSNVLQQITGLSSALLEVKPKYLRGALAAYIGSPSEVANEIAAKSTFMRNRTTASVIEVQQEIDNIMLDPSKYEKVRAFATRHGYFLQQGAQNVVDIITWRGAYNEAIAGKMLEREAVRRADAAVRKTQGSFAAEDMSRFETGGATFRLFTMFYSYFNLQANLLGGKFAQAMRDGGFSAPGKLFYIYIFGVMIPAALAEAIAQAMSGDLWDDDDDDGYLDNFLSVMFMGQFKFAAATVPFVGQAAQALVNRFNDKPYDDKLSVSPAISILDAFIGTPISVYKATFDDGSWKKAIKDTLTLVGIATGLPLGVLARPLGYAADVQQGRVEPANAADYVRGLISGRGPQ
jgi:hypothetical protein